jgi:hypothetical protein
VSLDIPFEAATVNAGSFAALLEICASVSRNELPETFVVATRIEAIPTVTGLSAIRTLTSLHVAGQRLTKTNPQFIAGNQFVLFIL